MKQQIRSLTTDFPALWANPHTAQRDRKRMVRLLVDDVTLCSRTGCSSPNTPGNWASVIVLLP